MDRLVLRFTIAFGNVYKNVIQGRGTCWLCHTKEGRFNHGTWMASSPPSSRLYYGFEYIEHAYTASRATHPRCMSSAWTSVLVAHWVLKGYITNPLLYTKLLYLYQFDLVLVSCCTRVNLLMEVFTCGKNNYGWDDVMKCLAILRPISKTRIFT